MNDITTIHDLIFTLKTTEFQEVVTNCDRFA